MTLKNSYNLYFLFLIVLIGISNVIQLSTLRGSKDKKGLPLKENTKSTEDLLKEKRQEDIVTNTAASFYFRQ
ncbi:hypothetical protein EQG63_04865 [Flavobacterium amnicola]|uniref:Uncharacterized protein n=1 Tax=Flavobacterium amnicola TaxID=2506422 RepID=A0A4Q1K5S4_9FLAO|nr:hypothetical protein [Flavobacterium amnicola]RXR21273.1 hypothetical protein EQG63_04865 [Flavobacterium amnicola]